MDSPKLDVYEKGWVYSHLVAVMSVFLFCFPYIKTFAAKAFQILWMYLVFKLFFFVTCLSILFCHLIFIRRYVLPLRGVGPRPRPCRRLDVDPSPPSTIPLLPSSDKKTLFVDLDRTLIISCTNPPPIDTYNSEELLVLTFTNNTYYVTKRPGVEQLFRAAIAAGFEVVIFTASNGGYASPILDWLDPMSEFITHRLYQESCSMDANGKYFKDLDVTGRQLNKSVIIDDNPRVYWKHCDNLLWVRPFKGDPQDLNLQKLVCFFEIEKKFRDVRRAIDFYYGTPLFLWKKRSL